MAYDPNNLSVLAFANGFTLWHYTTTDTALALAAGVGYFDGAAEMVRVGDMILANIDTDGIPGAGIFLVNRNYGGAVGVDNIGASVID